MGGEGDSFEDYIASIFQCYGCYVEKNLHLKDGGEEFLEVDLMVTDYSEDSPPKIYIVEAKSGKNWGFYDIFKIRGWMDFIDTETHKGFFVVNNPKDKDLNTLDKRFHDRIGVRVLSKENIENALQVEFGRESWCDKIDLKFWQYSHLLERKLLKKLNELKRSVKNAKCYVALERYYQQTHDEVFFTDNVVDRLLRLYGAFEDNPYISAKCGNEYLYHPQVHLKRTVLHYLKRCMSRPIMTVNSLRFKYQLLLNIKLG